MDSKVKQKTGRRKPENKPVSNRDMLYGISPVQLALDTKKRQVYNLYFKKGKTTAELEKIIGICRKKGIQTIAKSPDELSDLARTTQHQGVVLECSFLQAKDIDAFISNTPESSLVVVLDQVEDPQNFGAIVRTCAYLGADAVVIQKRHSAPLSPTASKASAGALEYFPVYEAGNLAKSLEKLKQQGYWIYGSSLDGSDFNRETVVEKSVLIMGNEGKGIRDLTRKNCDHLIKISGNNSTESLNVNAAAAILISHFIFNRPNG